VKRLFDVVASGIGLIAASPVLVPMIVLVWLQDRKSPFYVAARVGKNERPFRMVKLRSMVVNADSSGVDSTSADDRRITPIGRVIRRMKLDELTQLWNVLLGDMSMVGPRPNVKRETDLYTPLERTLLSVKPGITDFASIVFSDEGDILQGEVDPDVAYNQLIRPGKSRLGLFYLEKRSAWIDLQLCCLTAVSIFSRRRALRMVHKLLNRLRAPADLMGMALRRSPLEPASPPGTDKIVTSRH
jgi:lipopolysaccharide/colanic/teichoic acid biosynthesis glycosyltransferase